MTKHCKCEILASLTKDESITPSQNKKISMDLFLEILNTLFTKINNVEITYELLCYKLTRLIDECDHLSISRNIKKSVLSESDVILLLLFCHLHMNVRDKHFSTVHIYMVFPKKKSFKIVQSLTDRSNILLKINYIENSNLPSIPDIHYFKLTESAKALLLS